MMPLEREKRVRNVEVVCQLVEANTSDPMMPKSETSRTQGKAGVVHRRSTGAALPQACIYNLGARKRKAWAACEIFPLEVGEVNCVGRSIGKILLSRVVEGNLT